MAFVATLLFLTSCSHDYQGAGGRAASGREVERPRLLVVGLDGLEPRLLSRFIEAGSLPTFKQLIDRGSLATIDCVVGTSSPVVWTTVATSTPPEAHGITGFTVEEVPVTSTLRRDPAFWNIFKDLGISSATIGWMVTWPAEEDGGVIVSDRAHWGQFENKTFPENAVDLEKYHHSGTKGVPNFVQRFTDYPYDPEYEKLPPDHPDRGPNEMIHKRLSEIYIRDTAYAGMAEDVARKFNPAVLAVYFQGADYVSHGFWKWFEPEPFRRAGWEVEPREVELLGEVIPRYYAYLDRLLARILRLTNEETTVMILSDHGFQAGVGDLKPTVPYLSGNHDDVGTLILAGPLVEKLERQTGTITHFDILPTILYTLGIPVARDFHGRPLLEYFSDDLLAQREVRFVSSYDRIVTDEAHEVERSRHDETILEELRSLGYIE